MNKNLWKTNKKMWKNEQKSVKTELKRKLSTSAQVFLIDYILIFDIKFYKVFWLI
jgi:hypothetical protein